MVSLLRKCVGERRHDDEFLNRLAEAASELDLGLRRSAGFGVAGVLAVGGWGTTC